MPSGNLFRREQRQQHRVQLLRAQRELDRYRREQAELRAFAAPHRAEVERIRREAEEQARQRAEEARLQAEREAERLRERLRLEQRHLAQQQRQQEAAAARRRALDAAEQLAQACALAARQLQIQLDADNAAVAQLYPALDPALHALAGRADALVIRLTLLVRVLAGSADPHLAAHGADLATAQAIGPRCRANRPQAAGEHRRLRQCAPGALEVTTAAVRVALVAIDAAHAADLAAVGAIDLRVTAAELTHAAALAHVRAYPNLGLTFAEIADPEGAVANFAAPQLVKLNGKLAGHRVLTWRRERMPASRPNHAGAYLRIPDTLDRFPCRPGGEVFHDWIYDRAGHGQPAAEMAKYLAPGVVRLGLLDIRIDQTQQPNGKWVLTSRNLTLNVILDLTRTLLITFYKVG